MSIKISGDDDDDGSAGQINVVPLIDVLFSILTFFVLASIFLTRQQGLPLDLPQASPVSTNDLSKQLTLTITKEGKYFLDKDPIALKDVGVAVKRELDANPTSMVVIAGNKFTKYRFVVDILDELRQVNATRIAMATDTE